MTVTSITGADFTVTIGATAYSDQVTSGSITESATVVRTKTLSGIGYNQTDVIDGASIAFLYDDNAGLYDALRTAVAAGTSVAVVIVGDTGTWTGSAMWCESVDVSFDAAGVATCDASFAGEMSFA